MERSIWSGHGALHVKEQGNEHEDRLQELHQKKGLQPGSRAAISEAETLHSLMTLGDNWR